MVVLDRDVDDVAVKILPGGVDRQLQPVEAGVALGVGLDWVEGDAPDLELLQLSPVALQTGKALDGHPAVASNEVKHVLEVLLVERLNVLPEPEDDLISGLVAGVEGVLLQVVNVDLIFAVDDHVELVGLEDGEKVGGDDGVDALPKILDKFEDATGAVVANAEWGRVYQS